MRRRPSLLSLLVPLTLSAASALWACGSDSSATTTATSASSSGAGGGGAGGGGSSMTGVPDAGPEVRCQRDDGTDPVGLCTQKLVLLGEHTAAFDPARGVATSWDAATHTPDMDDESMVLHDMRDDAAYAAAIARYHHSASIYGDDEITATLDLDLRVLAEVLAGELATPPAGYAGELYLDLRTAAGGLRIINRDDLAALVDAPAEAYGRAIYDVAYAPLAMGDGGVADAVIGSPAPGGATAYAPADVATGALALVDLAVRHAADEPAHAAAWQDAAARALVHLHARARDATTGLYFAALVTSADPDHDVLAPAPPSGPPADALLTEVNARVALALLRAEALATANPGAVPAIAALPLEARAEAILAALDGASPGLWDPSGGPEDGDGGTLGGGYFAGWSPSSAALLTDKPTRANALALAAIHDAEQMGNAPHPHRAKALRTLLTDRTAPHAGFLTVVDDQDGYFRAVPPGFDFDAEDAGADPHRRSYASSANTAAVEGLSELWVGLPN